MKKILVINPNSNASVSSGLADALQGWRGHADLEVECATLQDGPFGIESAADIAAVEPLLLNEIRQRDDCAAYIIACYSDPGLPACRAAVAKPVFGMQQSAVATAIALGGRFGVLALSQASIDRHLVYLERLGVSPDRISAVGYGESRPVAPNDSAEGRRLNRRTEFIILQQ